MIRQQARDEVFNWARFVEYRLEDINRILMYGRVAQEDQDIIQLMSDAENVLRYRFFNRAGFVVLSSTPSEVGQRDVNAYFSDLVADGQTFVKLQADGQFETVWKTDGVVKGDAWSDFIPESAKLTADWTYPWVCGNCEKPKYATLTN